MIHHAPRREPRVLALNITGARLAFVVSDLLEMRSSGDDAATARSLRLTLRRLIRRERPTAIVASGSGARHLRAVTGGLIPVVAPPRNPLPFSVVGDVYPEAFAFAPTLRLRRLASYAVTTLARSTFPSRRYAKSRRPRTPLRRQRCP
jgi:hypothetical protein